MRPIFLGRPSALMPALVVALILSLALPSLVHATYPGRNGKIAFWASPSGHGEIFTMDPDGGNVTNVSPGLNAYYPVWSPDGSKLAFTTPRDGNYEIYTMNADGSGLTRVTNNAANDFGAPSWSPDGRKIAFARASPDWEIFTINADGTAETRLTNNDSANEDSPAWSTDGTRIAYHRQEIVPCEPPVCVPGAEHIWTMKPDGTDQRDVSQDTPDFARQPSWAPYGSTIAFQGFNDGEFNFDLYTINSDGTGLERITTDPSGEISPKLAPDGSNKILFWSNRTNYGDIFTMNLDGTGLRNLTHNTESGSQDPDWQPLPYTSYARPKGATPFRASLVVAYRNCTVPNEQHGPSLAYPSCAPAVQESNWLTTGTADSNGQATQFVGALRLDTIVGDPATPADEADVAAVMDITDVRNKAGGTDYPGEVQASIVIRITDRFNAVAAGGGSDAATLVDIPFPVNAPCVPTADPLVGSTCAVTTSFEAIVPGAVREGKRSIWQMGQVQVYDGGADGNPATADNTLFARQGVFVP